MITVSKLFLRRLASEWNYQFQVVKTVVDWIVAIYIVIPFLAIFVDTYLSWWRQVPAEFNVVPLNEFLGIVLLFIWTGAVRIFVEDADQIFLFQRKVWMTRLIKYSIAYYLGLNFLITTLFCLVLAPFLLLHYGLNMYTFVWFTLITFVSRVSIGILKQLVEFRFRGWIRGLVKTVLVVITGVYLRQSVVFLLNRPTFFFLFFLLLFIALLLLIYKRLTLVGTLLEDISRGKDAKLKLANVLLRYAGTYMKRPIVFRTRPWLFRNSELLFKQRNPENGLVELCLKSTLRHGANVRFYLQVIGVCVLMVSAFPSDWKWVLWGVFMILLIAVVKLFWLEAINSAYVSLFSLPTKIKLGAASRSLFLMALPGQIILGLVVTLQTQGWLSALVILPIGIFAGYFIAKKLAMFS